MQTTNLTWVLVSDAARARVFTAADQGRIFNLAREYSHPQSRFANQELVTDRPGRTQQSGPTGRMGTGPAKGSHSAMEPQVDPKVEEHVIFARELADELEQGLNRHEYTHLILAAGPQFLGMLRNVLSDQVKKHVTASVDKDYTRLDRTELQTRFSGLVPE